MRMMHKALRRERHRKRKVSRATDPSVKVFRHADSDSVLNKIYDAWTDTGFEFKDKPENAQFFNKRHFNGIMEPRDLPDRFYTLSPQSAGVGVSYYDIQIKEIMKYSLANSAIDENAFDLENFVTETYVGSNTFRKLLEYSGSNKFDDYILAKDRKGKYVVSEPERNFIKRAIYNISHSLSDITRVSHPDTRSKQD